MGWTTSRTRGRARRTVSAVAVAALAAAALAAAALVGAASPASAEPAPNSTPATATPFTTIPFEGGSDGWRDAIEATDPAGQQVSQSCNGGQPVFGTMWWRYDAAQASTYVVHAAEFVGTVGGYAPVRLAVLSADASTVLECGAVGTDISSTGARTVAVGQSVLLVVYLATSEKEVYGPEIGVYPSTGVVPANDEPEAPTVIGTLPFTVTQDTTLATADFGGVGCFTKFGRGPDIWFRWTADRTDLVDFRAEADYWVEVSAAALVDGVPAPGEACGGMWEAQAGTTYLIAVWAISDDLQQTGTVTLTADYLPPKPTVSATVDASGVVAKKTGVVTLSGTVGCAGSTGTPSLAGTLRQVYKRQVQTAGLTFSGVTSCTSGRWTARASSSTFLFTGGTADVSVTVQACNQRGCSTATGSATVKLKVA